MLDDVLTDDRSKAPEDLLIEADDLERILGRHRRARRPRGRRRSACGSASTRTVPMTLREVGENLGLTRERVRQLENQALQKLAIALGASRGGSGH